MFLIDLKLAERINSSVLIRGGYYPRLTVTSKHHYHPFSPSFWNRLSALCALSCCIGMINYAFTIANCKYKHHPSNIPFSRTKHFQIVFDNWIPFPPVPPKPLDVTIKIHLQVTNKPPIFTNKSITDHPDHTQMTTTRAISPNSRSTGGSHRWLPQPLRGRGVCPAANSSYKGRGNVVSWINVGKLPFRYGYIP